MLSGKPSRSTCGTPVEKPAGKHSWKAVLEAIREAIRHAFLDAFRDAPRSHFPKSRMRSLSRNRPGQPSRKPSWSPLKLQVFGWPMACLLLRQPSIVLYGTSSFEKESLFCPRHRLDAGAPDPPHVSAALTGVRCRMHGEAQTAGNEM